MSLLYKEMMTKYNLHQYEAVAMEALASATPLLMMKLKTGAVASFIGAIVLGIAKEDKEKARELQLAYDEMVKNVYKALGSTIAVGIIAIVEDAASEDEDVGDSRDDSKGEDKPSGLH